jgi:hypothetical protein
MDEVGASDRGAVVDPLAEVFTGQQLVDDHGRGREPWAAATVGGGSAGARKSVAPGHLDQAASLAAPTLDRIVVGDGDVPNLARSSKAAIQSAIVRAGWLARQVRLTLES